MSDLSRKRRKRVRSGRPRKFDELSRPVTVTLPESTITALTQIHHDRAKAIVEACRQARQQATAPISVEVIEVGPGRGCVLVGDSEYLRRLKFMHLVELQSGRNLISVNTGTPVTTVEISLLDLLDAIPLEEERERKLVAELVRLFRRTRQMKVMHKEEILIIPHDFPVK
jgi:hypothetical protein